MSRLIDADELVKKFKQWMGIEYRMQMFIADVIKTINGQPTVEVPVTEKWIPCSERLPEDDDNRFYMCIVENHEEDLPMFLQYVENCGFGYWNDIYDGHTLGFVDSEFKTNEELGYERVVAWMPLPESYHPDKCHGCFGAENNDCERCAK